MWTKLKVQEFNAFVTATDTSSTYNITQLTASMQRFAPRSLIYAVVYHAFKRWQKPDQSNMQQPEQKI